MPILTSFSLNTIQVSPLFICCSELGFFLTFLIKNLFTYSLIFWPFRAVPVAYGSSQVEFEPQMLAYAIATAMQDLSHPVNCTAAHGNTRFLTH